MVTYLFLLICKRVYWFAVLVCGKCYAISVSHFHIFHDVSQTPTGNWVYTRGNCYTVLLHSKYCVRKKKNFVFFEQVRKKPRLAWWKSTFFNFQQSTKKNRLFYWTFLPRMLQHGFMVFLVDHFPTTWLVNGQQVKWLWETKAHPTTNRYKVSFPYFHNIHISCN